MQLQFSRSKTFILPSSLSSIPGRFSIVNRSPMASASMAVLPSAPVRQISTHGQRARVSSLNKFATRSRVSMTASVGSQVAVADDLLFKDYKPTCAFLFPGQVLDWAQFMSNYFYISLNSEQQVQSIPIIQLHRFNGIPCFSYWKLNFLFLWGRIHWFCSLKLWQDMDKVSPLKLVNSSCFLNVTSHFCLNSLNSVYPSTM